MSRLRAAAVGVPIGVILALTTGVGAALAAEAPVGMLTNEPIAVLASSTVTNTGPSIVSGDLDLSPGSSVTGFGPGTVTAGAMHIADSVAVQAQADLTTSMGDASSRASTASVPADLVGLTLVPGVYDGAALSLSGPLELDGDASSVFIFRATSTLITSSGSAITMVGGATSCNVWWLVPSSVTLGSASTFVGTIMAGDTITAGTGASIAGRLLASTGAVNLDSNTVTRPTGCAASAGGTAGTGSAGGGGAGAGTSGGTGASGGAGTGGSRAGGGSPAAELAPTGAIPVPLMLPLGLLAAGALVALAQRLVSRRAGRRASRARS